MQYIIRERAFSFWLAILHKDETCSLKFSLIGSKIYRSLLANNQKQKNKAVKVLGSVLMFSSGFFQSL